MDGPLFSCPGMLYLKPKIIWTMSEMVKYRAALWSFYKLTAHVFYHLWHSPCSKHPCNEFALDNYLCYMSKFLYFFWLTHYVSMNKVLNLSKNCNYFIPPTHSFCYTYGLWIVLYVEKKMWNVFLYSFHPFPFKISFQKKVILSIYHIYYAIFYWFQGQ